ncbi:uncharacterized protein LOC118370910 isoform X2 [Oncorhynchus keta]|uniref:uncharacterized protein LOC118370910 isoform X2 n=1 Tax=Oncorhynchus keta TaxID=8018 RepID=UPI0015FD0A77|nr:uncharacterized protein LOC118370910 isoform X2 [Oncorhynchus keta]
MATKDSSTCDLKVVLLGGRNSGKSEVGNVLLDREEFVIKERTTCSRRVGEVAACEVASSEDLLTPDDSGAPDFGVQELALPEASGGWWTEANHSILDVEGFLSSMASVLQGNQEGLMWNMGGRQTLVVNLPDCLHAGPTQSHHLRWNGQNGRKRVTLFSPGHQALLLVQQPKEPERMLVKNQEDIVDIQSLGHPRLRDMTLKEITEQEACRP